jgi:LuxR family transcriptional activator of conjugal transfer of Ti plasmids
MKTANVAVGRPAETLMHRAFQKFIDLISSAGDAEGFSKAMAGAATAMDLSCFAYLALPCRPNKKPLIISTYPTEWVTHYLDRHYEGLDPVVKQALKTPEPFRWGSGLTAGQLSSVQHELLDEASEFGIRFGFTVPIHDGRSPVAALTFATDVRRPQFERCINSHGRALQLMAMYFHAHVQRKLPGDRKIGEALLSPREVQCLEWAAEGKSAWETGRILGISRHTVASYLGCAKEKLGVRTIVQAAARLAAAKGEQHN